MNYRDIKPELINFDYLKAMENRHSVRKFNDNLIEDEKVLLINNLINDINEKTKLNFSLVTNEPEAFNGNKPHYGAFANCRNYLILAGKKNQDELIGYYGELLVLFLQSLGINSCFVALTYRKGKVNVNLEKDESIYLVVAIGYGINNGKSHKSKDITKLSNIKDDSPEWFKVGVKYALLAPTAINQQKFYLEYIKDNDVRIKRLIGPCSKMDIGIVKCNFDLSTDVDVNWI